LTFYVKTSKSDPRVINKQDKMIEYFLPIFPVIMPPKIAPKHPPRTVKLTKFYKFYLKNGIFY